MLSCSFLAVPFLLELRALMDWMWTDTTLGIFSWLQMEDIYANIFVLKCIRWAEKVEPTMSCLFSSLLCLVCLFWWQHSVMVITHQH